MSFAIAVLTGLGVGSGGLYILFLTLIKDTPQSQAQGLNLLFFITASLAALIFNTVKKRISYPSVALFLSTGILGTVLGAKVASLLDGRALSFTFGAILVVLGLAGLLKKS